MTDQESAKMRTFEVIYPKDPSRERRFNLFVKANGIDQVKERFPNAEIRSVTYRIKDSQLDVDLTR